MARRPAGDLPVFRPLRKSPFVAECYRLGLWAV